MTHGGTQDGPSWTVPGYREIRTLGSGASGRVVLAVPLAGGPPVAVKYLSARLLADARFRERFRAEARVLARLTDPHLVRFLDYVETPQGAAIVMEPVRGVSLRAVLEREHTLEPEAALVVLKGSLLGLAAAHAAGVVHRDYKPENVLVPEDGASRLVDFGIAVPVGSRGAFAGTPAYMAPEQWTRGTASPATDVYAATVVCYECLTGGKPFHATTIDQWAYAHTTVPVPVDALPEPVRQLVARGMAKDAAARPGSAAAFVTELETAARGAYGEDWERRGRRRLAALALALLAALPGMLRPDELTRDRPPRSERPTRHYRQDDRDDRDDRHLDRHLDRDLRPQRRLRRHLTVVTTIVVVVIIVVVIVVVRGHHGEPRSEETPVATDSTGASASPTGPVVIIRKRIERARTATYSYEMIGCCSQQIWSTGRLEYQPTGSSLDVRRVFDGGDAAWVPPEKRKAHHLEHDYVFLNPDAEAEVAKARARQIGGDVYATTGGAWRAYAAAQVKQSAIDGSVPRTERIAGDTASVRDEAGPEHLLRLLEVSWDVTSSTSGGTRAYRGSTTSKAMGYPGPSTRLTFVLTVGSDGLPTELSQRLYTPGGNTPYTQYTTAYAHWGEGGPVERPA